MTQQALTVLGSTGGIGESTLDAVFRYPGKFRVFALVRRRQVGKLTAQCRQFRPEYAVVGSVDHAAELEKKLKQKGIDTQVSYGAQALIDVVSANEVSGMVYAIVNAAGLPSTLAAAQRGKTICLTNKKALVVSGTLSMGATRQSGATVLPIDSEHNAILQVLPRGCAGHLNEHGINSTILTASGGPFFSTGLSTSGGITSKQATEHPDWDVGRRISVDSASIINKGLKLIEAHRLFNYPSEKLEAVIRPQSMVHNMMHYRDGLVLVQLDNPDMRIPTAYCLGLPERIDSDVGELDFGASSVLTFRKPDFDCFPCLKLACQTVNAGGAAPCILNAANKVVVTAFLDKHVRFADIAQIVVHCLAQDFSDGHHDIESLLAQDTQTCRQAGVFIGKQ